MPKQTKKVEKKQEQEQVIQITPPKIGMLEFTIEGTAPYMQARFSEKAMQMMMGKMAAGTTARGKTARAPRDFDDDYERAKHVSTEGWVGIPASAFRNAMISACRTVGFKMTLAKLSVFVEHDGEDRVDGVPLVKIEGEPERVDMAARNADFSADIRIRPLWRKWGAKVRVRFDEDQFTAEDVCNLMSRVGMQVGIGEGRPDSKKSAGMGFGTFAVTEINGVSVEKSAA